MRLSGLPQAWIDPPAGSEWQASPEDWAQRGGTGVSGKVPDDSIAQVFWRTAGRSNTSGSAAGRWRIREAIVAGVRNTTGRS